MSMISLRRPDSIHKAARQLAEKEEISLNQLISTAVAEKLSALSAEQIILERAKHGDRNRFLAALDRSPDVPDPHEIEGEEATVENILALQSPVVQQYSRKLMKEIVAEGVESFSTSTKNGDLRFRVTNGIFAEINFFRRTNDVNLRLYFAPDDLLDDLYKLAGKTSKQARYDRRLDCTEPIPPDVLRNIRRSRDFMLKKRN